MRFCADMLPPGLIQCSLCQGVLPGNNDEVFQAHMRDQHRAYFDLDFMFAVFSLNAEEKDIILDLINEQLEQRKQNAEPKHKECQEIRKPTKQRDKDTVAPSHSKFEVKVNLPSNILVTAVQDITVPELQDTDSDSNERSNDNLQEGVSADEVKRDIKQMPILPVKKKIPERPQGESVSGKDNKKIRRKYVRQVAIVPGNLPGFCKLCDKDYKQLGYHQKTEHGTISTCDLCSKQFNSLHILRRHKLRFHGPSSPCPDCGKLVKKMSLHQKNAHTSNEDKRWKCSTCGKGFATRYSLFEHERIHGEKQFPCRVSNGLCGKASTSPGNRTKHEALCKYWEKLGSGVKTEQSGNIKCEVEFEEGKLELDV